MIYKEKDSLLNKGSQLKMQSDVLIYNFVTLTGCKWLGRIGQEVFCKIEYLGFDIES